MERADEVGRAAEEYRAFEELDRREAERLPSQFPPVTIAQLLSGPVGPGRLVWIGLRPSRAATMIASELALLIAHQGIEGDRYKTQRDGARQVTLIAAEDIAAIASFLRRQEVSPPCCAETS